MLRLIDVAIAKEELKKSIKGEGFQCDIDTYEAAIDALEFQIPKKPITHRFCEDDTDYFYFTCPNHCSIYCEVYPQDNYCRKCGQKLDWSEKEETNDSMDKIPEEW